ncbi:MAG: hypothetical protein OXC55_07885 [Chloroflexi bacterium]|nr:hypothetical protein [Chloroflexota bacterium]
MASLLGLLLGLLRETFVVGLFSWSPRIFVVRLCVFCSVAVASLYFGAALLHSVSPDSSYELGESVAIAAFSGLLIVGTLLGGGAIARAESVDEKQGRFRLIGLTTFLLVAVPGSVAGSLFMVLVPLAFIPSAIVLTVIVISGRCGVSSRQT